VHAYFYSDEGTLNAYKGRRIGYSFAVVVAFLLEGLFYPNSYYPIVSRSLTQSKSRISDLEDLIGNAKINIPTEKTNTDYIELWNGTAFEAYSSDSDTSRGRDSARAVLMDEMAFIEDEEEAHRAFSAFLALGEDRKMVEISTPNTKNDLFMQTHRRGTRSGSDGVVSIKQPTFEDADDIDIDTSLYEQELQPVRPEINVDQLETERLADPEGFGQEYLCRPVVDEYRFFSEDSIRRAMERSLADGYNSGLDSPKGGARRVMGVDIGINRDDTVISITDHNGEKRDQKSLIVADADWLQRAGVKNPDRGNANDIAELIAYLYEVAEVDIVVMDKGGVGQTFERIIERRLGRSVIGFDFSDKEGVADMMGDTNMALRSNKMILLNNERLYDELSSIVKEKKTSYSKPRFSGKDNSESGKDDAAMATVLSAFPPSQAGERVTSPSTKQHSGTVKGATVPSKREKKPSGDYNPSYGATSVARSSRSRNNRYASRRTRR
jgi:phage FluMu gp28-like protein